MTISTLPGTWRRMSAGQRGIWFEQCIDPDSNAYNLGACVRFKQRIDRARLDAVLALLAQRHALMRARFALVDDEACWSISAQALACSVLSAGELDEAQGRTRIAALVLRPYALADEHPWRFAVVDLDQGSLFGIACHHIVSDLHSMNVVVGELQQAYAALEEGAVWTAAPAAGYADFCQWQGGMLSASEGGRHAPFWRARLSGVPDAVQADSPCPAPAASARINFAIDRETSGALMAAARSAGATAYTAVLTTFQVMLAHRYRSDCVAVGTPFSGRNQARFHQTVGYFVNLLPMVYECHAHESFACAAARNGRQVRSALRHGQYPFAAMVEDLGRARTAGPLVWATLTFQNTVLGLPDDLTRLALGVTGGGMQLGGEQGAMLALPDPRPQFPLGLTIAQTESGFEGSLQYDTGKIAGTDGAAFLEDWLALNAACAQQPDSALAALLAKLGARRAADNLAAALDDSIAHHAERRAVASPAGDISYRLLGQRSGAVASRLLGCGAGRGARVAVIGDGGADTIIALVAVLRAGAAFVPIDADAGSAQIERLLRAARVSAVVLGTGSPIAWSGDLGIALLSVDAVTCGGDLPAARCAPLDPAWLMFTSGTTGTSKAAVVPHEAALAHARAIAGSFDLGPEDRVLQFASLSFDEHAEEIFPTLLAGACVVCMPRIRFQDPETLLAAASAARISVLHLPTSYWHLWMDETRHRMPAIPASLRLVNVGGEQASISRLRTWAQCIPRRVRWFNSYGLTEAAVTSLLYELPGDDAVLERMARVPAGRPVAGTLVRIDGPEGEVGELLLGGVGVGSGYLDSPGHATGFFTEAGTHGPVRWLRTGDLARLAGDGDVEIFGRLDRSIKLRGVRVALPELEAALAGHPALKECVAVAVNEEEGDRRIELHVALADAHTITLPQLQAYLRDVMPGAPAVAAVHVHAAIPRTAGRKPDYARMRIQAAPGAAPVAADCPLPDRVTSIFTRHLGPGPIAATDNLFAVGGHSLLAMRIISALRRELGVDFTISDFLADPSIDGVARLCRQRAAMPVRDALPAPDEQTGSYPLAHAQRRALTFEAAAQESGGAASAAIMISGPLSASQMRRAWDSVAARHRLLEADISLDGNCETGDTARAGAGLHVHQARQSLSGRAFARAARALVMDDPDHRRLRANLVSSDGGEHLLFVEARHATVDGGCLALLLRDFAHACATGGAPLPSPAGSYRAFVAAEAAWLASPARATALAYWARYLDGAGAPTHLPGLVMENSDDFSSSRLGFNLGTAARDRLFALAGSQRCTPFAVVLSAFLALLHRYTASEDILIGVPVALRDVLGIDDVVGPTLNALPFRLGVTAVDTFTALVQKTQLRLSASLEHAVLPCEEIAAACDGLRGRPLPIQVVAQDDAVLRHEEAGLAFSELREREGQSPVALLVGVRIGRGIRVEFEYRRALVPAATVAGIASAFRTLLGELVECPDRAIGAARMIKNSVIAQALSPRPAATGHPTLLHQALAAGARAHPKRLALVCGESACTYGQLENLVNRHAVRLIAAGLEPGAHVIVASKKGMAEVVAMLAILKAGGVYIPLACHAPPSRAAGLAARTAARLVTGADELRTDFGRAERFAYVAVDLEDCTPCPAPLLSVSAGASAYLLFTSGSSGEPKGVEVSHQAAMTTIAEVLRRFDIGPGDVLYGVSALGFDLSVFDVFGALAAGACLVLPRAAVVADPFVWLADIRRHGVTVWNSVPSALDMLLEAGAGDRLPSLRRLLVSGDWIGLDLPPRARRACPDAVFVALGGATEASIWSNCHMVEAVDPAWRSIPYGVALAGQSMFVAEPGGWPAPMGVVGEICIGGQALAKGYWGQPDLTAEKFVRHAQTGNRIYRTGDLGRYGADGAIEFLGRRDRQIKLRGHRIEIGEIEAALGACAGVRRALVSVAVDGAGLPGSLVAHVQADDAAALSAAALHRHAQHMLPPYMQPAHYCLITTIPLTANGKIDWAALPVPAPTHAVPAKGALPLTGTELRLAAYWPGMPAAGAPDRDGDFFAQGGNSLQALKLLTLVSRAFHRKLSLSQWLTRPTLAHLARLLDDEDGAPSQGQRAVRLQDRVSLADDLVFAGARRDAGAVFITGASGLIGSRVAARYLSETGADLVCLVRTRDDTLAEGRLPRLLAAEGMPEAQWRKRVRFVLGDLAQLRFGLADAGFESLAAGIGTVFHIGASVNLVAGYDSLAPVNVGGTHEAIRLAALAGASLQFVSSVGVLPYGAGRVVTETDSIDQVTSLLTGYCESKWVAEQTVRLAVARGLAATIYRPGLTLDEQDASGSDVLALLMALAGIVGALPALAIPVDITTAGYVAAAMVQVAGDPRSAGGTFHLTHPEPVQLAELVRHAGVAMPMLPFAQWRSRLEDALPGIGDLRLAALGAMIAAQDEADITPATIDCGATSLLLRGTAIQCVPVVSIMTGYLRRSDLTPAAGPHKTSSLRH